MHWENYSSKIEKLDSNKPCETVVSNGHHSILLICIDFFYVGYHTSISANKICQISIFFIINWLELAFAISITICVFFIPRLVRMQDLSMFSNAIIFSCHSQILILNGGMVTLGSMALRPQPCSLQDI